jgi:Zn-dependent protease
LSDPAATPAGDSPEAELVAPGAVAADTQSAPPARSSNFVGAGILVLWLALGAELLVAREPPRPFTFAFVMVGWLLSVMAHEYSHALVAWLGGDHTVKAKGYLDFDPRRYGAWQTTLFIPLLALALGGIGFPGGAVYLRNDLMRSRLWRAAASLAGPAATGAILLVLAGALQIWATGGGGDALFSALTMLAWLQAMALVLNLLPLPGFDGFNTIRPFLPARLAPAIGRVQGVTTVALLVLLFVVPGGAAPLLIAAGALSRALGLQGEALQDAWAAFHFWR